MKKNNEGKINIKNDDDLVYLTKIRKGDMQALEELVVRYRIVIDYIINSKELFLPGGSKEDLFQEGYIGLMKAISGFDIQSKSSFYSYAYSCISNKIFDSIKASHANKNSMLTDSEELDAGMQVGDSSTPEDIVIKQDTLEMIAKELQSSLSEFEVQVFGKYLNGMSYNDIATEMNKPVKTIDNTLQKIKKKLKEMASLLY